MKLGSNQRHRQTAGVLSGKSKMRYLLHIRKRENPVLGRFWRYLTLIQRMHVFFLIKTKQTNIWHRTFDGHKYQSLEKAVSLGTTFGSPQLLMEINTLWKSKPMFSVKISRAKFQIPFYSIVPSKRRQLPHLEWVFIRIHSVLLVDSRHSVYFGTALQLSLLSLSYTLDAALDREKLWLRPGHETFRVTFAALWGPDNFNVSPNLHFIERAKPTSVAR